MAWIPDLDWSRVALHLSKILAALVLALPIAWDRERTARGAGLRTFPLVAVGSCSYLMIGQVVLEGSESHARLLYGLMTGIGFIGGGSILKDRGSVSGTSTAASIWNTGAIGAAVAWSRFEVALVLSLINFLLLRVGAVAKRLAEHGEHPPR
jgi:putative Mg2+ transporter-C (MgtC) family protein